MKKTKTIFAVALAAAAVSFASCNMENDVNPSDQTGNLNSLVKVTLPKNVESRAVGKTSAGTQLTTLGGKLLWSNSSGMITREVTVVADGTASPTKDQVKIGDLSTGAVIEEVEEGSKVCTFIGTHVGTGQPSGSLVGRTISSVQDAYFTVAVIADGLDAVVSNVPVYGADEALVIQNNGGVDYLVADFQVRAIGSRIQIGEIKGDPATVRSYDIAGVFINNYFPQMPYDQALVAGDIVFNDKDYTGYTSAYPTVLRDVEATVDAGMGYTTDDLNYTPTDNNTDFWAYNVFPNTGLTRAELPHIIIKLNNLVDVNDQLHGTKWLTVKGYYDVTASTSLTTMVGGNSYTFGGATGLTFTLTDVKDRPEEGEMLANVKVEAMPWTDNLVTPEF